MKMVTAIIKPFKLEDVRLALMDIGIEGMTVTEVQGFGRQRGKTTDDAADSGHSTINFLPKMKLEIAIPASVTDKVVKLIQDTACTDRIGDGKIFVTSIEHAVRIRTGETGLDAL